MAEYVQCITFTRQQLFLKKTCITYVVRSNIQGESLKTGS